MEQGISRSLSHFGVKLCSFSHFARRAKNPRATVLPGAGILVGSFAASLTETVKIYPRLTPSPM
jgi:hypothetical protein